MRKLIVLALSMLALASPARGQEAPIWVESSDRATVAKAGITVPLSAGTLKVVELREFGNGGVDVYAQYQSADEAVFGTIFVYAPTLPDIGLTFLATDEAIRRRLGASTHVAKDRLVPVAGVRDAGRRIIYEGAEAGKTASAAIFTRAGSWVVVVRVSGPAAREAEITAGVDALLTKMTFPKGSEPLRANVIKVEPCTPVSRLIAAKTIKPDMGDAGMFALMAEPGVVDDKGHSALNPLRKVPDRLCRESSELRGTIPVQIFRAVEKSDLPFMPRLYVLHGDAGIMIEVSEPRDKPGSFYVLRHGVGRMYAFGMLDRQPSKAQLWALIDGPDVQPSFARFTSKYLTADGHDSLSIDCSRTAEGCQSETAKTPADKPQSSR